MKKILLWILTVAMVCTLAAPASAVEQNSFVLTAVNANSVIIEPVRIPYTAGQTVKDALLASGHSFVGLEQGFIYEIDGITANFSLFYDGEGFDLSVDAADIRAICIGVSSVYSEELLDLIVAMARFREMGNVQMFPDAVSAYEDGLAAIRNGNAQTAAAVLTRLNGAIQAYEAILNGPKYTVTVSAAQGGSSLAAPVVTLTDSYGNVTSGTGTSFQVIAGTYQFRVSDGGFNRAEGSLTVSGNTTLSTTLPHGEWFGDVKILDSDKNPYPCIQNSTGHTAVFQILDSAREISSLYLNVGQGAVPDANNTKLRTIYTGTNGLDYSKMSRSWESTATALTYLVTSGMEGTSFQLEAQYTDAANHTQIQSYSMVLERVPTLKTLRVIADGTVLPLEFNPSTFTYDLVTVSDMLDIEAVGFAAGYEIRGAGRIAANDRATITVAAGGKESTYTLNITKKESVEVTLNVPSGVTVQVENASGSVIAPTNGKYNLIPGETYTYRSTKNTHYHTTATFRAEAGLTVQVAEPVVQDWLTNLMLYNGSNSSTRIAYPADSLFQSSDHDYVYTVSDCNTTVYIQADSAKVIQAFYRTQTTSQNTHNLEKVVTVDKPVGTGGAQFLSQVIAKSGYGNEVILRVSETRENVTYYQNYNLTLGRSLHLSTCIVSDSEGELVLMDSQGNTIGYDRDVTQYHVSVNREETRLGITATFPNTSDTTSCCGGYYAVINGERYDSLEKVQVELNTDLYSETVKIQVCHIDSQTVATEYVFNVRKTDPVSITFATNPSNAIVYLINNLNGKRVLGNNGVYSLTPGGSYTYTVTCTGYRGVTGTYTAPEANGTHTISLAQAAANTSLRNLSSEWPHLRQNSSNNGVINAPTPVLAEEAVLYWATKIGDGYDKNACGCPILVDGYLYTYAGTTLYKVDTLSGEIVATGTMDHASSYAINPPTYAAGMLFVGLADGSVQAFNAATLESLWIYRDPLGGQPNCSIVYHNGYVYTGFWVGETSVANYVCISATDEDPSNHKEEKLATWKYSSQGGFYWAGAYVCDDYLLIGTDDGASGYTSGKGRLLSFDPLTGELLDQKQMDVVGDIRSSITAYNGKFYFTNKGGYFFEATVSGSGEIQNIRRLKLYNYANSDVTPPMSTCTPTIYKGRAYVGVSGSNQFGAYSGHNITVIDIPNWEIAYTVRTQGYPQTSGVLTSYYEQSDGSVYVYFFDNYTPGKLRVLKDKPGQTRADLVSTEYYSDRGTTTTYETAYALFTPHGNQAQYAICSPIVDSSGTIYFKNDSAYLMAVGSTIRSLEITQAPAKLTYRAGEVFDGTGMKVTAHYTNGISRDVTDYVIWSKEPLTANDTDFVIQLPYVMYQNNGGAVGVNYQKPFAAVQLTVEGDAKFGDVTGNGVINAEDAQHLMQYINGLIPFSNAQMTLGDVSGDGRIDMKDVALIAKYLDGRISAFPAQKNK